MLRRGDRDATLLPLRASLASLGLLPAHTAPADPLLFDENVDAAIRAFQQQRGLIVDGRVGPVTQRELIAAKWSLGDRTLSYTLSAPMSGDDVVELQSRLCELGYDVGQTDGVFTARLDAAVREFQRHRGLADDGVFGPRTLRELQWISPMATGGRPQYLREIAQLRQAGPLLGGKRIAIDPARGGDDPGWVADGVSAADLAFDMAQRLAARMVATGMQAFLTRGAHSNPSQAERAKFANDVAADLVLSLHVDGSTSPHASGIATFHFGTDTGNNSSVGETLAHLVHRELLARTGMIDCRVHHRPWEILRRTQMPAVQVEIGYITNDVDRARLVDEGFRDRVADGLLVAVKRLYLDGRDDRPTGTFTFHDLLEYERSVRT
ncbi:MAG: N-acetylmuramoyl-L-alanine amidase [Actinobacteria bacterium 69-20]|jgi:N-acetylmuramoyl-L-alanine amidase|nr:N-acetylmuramoyl-L-alanine amidase [Actinomycetota bacterium]OJV24845.1 MAG: N-acetylmuramoyl-L-alanine amidase [Actinobacteria bacterium 69-20]